MRTDFQFVAIPIENFTKLFSMNDAEVASRGAKRMTVDEHPGYPCRVSLIDAPVGERVILTPFQHHNGNSPYQSAGPIFVREGTRDNDEDEKQFHDRIFHLLQIADDSL